MFAVNYKDNRGFMVLSGDITKFPILAHSEEGEFSFDISESNPLSFWISERAKLIEEQMALPLDEADETYLNWKDITNPEYTYEIEAVNEAPSIYDRRRNSTGKGRITPFTGERLKWHQGTGYNYNTPGGNKLVGCPAVAIGMLAYDLYRRPSFPGNYPFNLLYANDEYTQYSENVVSKMFRQIADSIPNYSWGVTASGATPNEILIGLKKLGFKNAKYKSYDFEEAYKNMKEKKHGILLAG